MLLFLLEIVKAFYDSKILYLVIANIFFQEHKRRLYTWTSPDGQYWYQTDYILSAKDGEALYSQQKQDQELTVALIMNSLLPNSGLNWRK